jgi:glycosyltransferase involved in cell wall biosynthesis
MANILIIAGTCHPGKGSEGGLGWNWIRQISSRHSVTAIVGEWRGNREAIQEALQKDPELAKQLKFVFLEWFPHPQSGLALFVWQTFQPIYYRRYRRWMIKAYHIAKDLCAQQRFDLVHQITIATYREPGFPWELPVPFAWGPVGGLGNMPWRCLPSLGPVEGTRHFCRNVVNLVQMRCHRRFHRAVNHARAIFAMDSASKELLRERYGTHSDVVAAAFCDLSHPRRRVRKRDTGPLRLVFAGLHLSRKGLSFLLDALASLPDHHQWKLDVLGSGIMTPSWQRKARRLRLFDRVTFHGYVSDEERDRILDESDVLVFPSLLEGWPAMVAEAISFGMPVITTNLHGMRDIVTKNCGFLVNADDPRNLVRDIASAVAKLDGDRALLSQLSRGALDRAHELSAQRQAPILYRCYEAVLNGTRT